MPAQPDTVQRGTNSLLAAATESYLRQFEENCDHFPGRGIDWLDQRRQTSLALFGKSGFPNQRQEDWRYTPLKAVINKQYELVRSAQFQSESHSVSSASYEINGLESYQLVFMDGVFSAADSSLAALNPLVQVLPLSAALQDYPDLVAQNYSRLVPEQHQGFTALNGAMHQDGYVLIMPPDTVLDKPLELLFVSDQKSALLLPRNLIVMKANARASIIERFVSNSDEPSLCNGITEIFLSNAAELDYYLVQQQGRSANQVCSVWAKQAQNSRFSCHTITLGGGLVRNELKVDLAEPGAHCDMLGVYSLSGKQHVDNHTTVMHSAPDCTSNELYKGVLDQRSRGVFHGRIKVEKDAQKTDAQQANNTLLLSRDAEIDTKPQLEIYADDVKCSHGATIGQLDEAALFYLRSRGIDTEAARSMLTYAFVNEVLGEITISPLKDYLEAILGEQLIEGEGGLEQS